jgi:omega-hydroxy-beta-dihydromenaquinone-9 sulfotransferase
MVSNEAPPIKYGVVSPRFWHGMPSRVWIPILAKNSFQISFSRMHIASGVTAFMPISDLLGLAQHAIYGRRIERMQLAGPPIFVLGHWRSGTTLLHELLGLDQRYASPTTYECFAPSHFLLTESIISKYFNWLIPNRRPMDNMKAGWSLPQEDEFALMNLGAPTPYLRLVFPCHEYPYQGTLASDGFRPEELERWKFLFHWFMKALTFKTNKPLILKSPPHTGRIGILKQMYPDAKFVHIVRDPRKLFPSTMKLWNSLDQFQSIQVGEYQSALKQFVIRSLVTMYDSFEKDRVGLSDKQLIDVRYEDLAKDPISVCRQIYHQLELDHFAQMEPLLQARTAQEKEYRPNQFGNSREDEAEFMTAWHGYATKYGYA